MTRAHWLYNGSEVLTCILAPADTPPDTIRAIAIEQHRRVPLCYPVAPFEHEAKLQRAEVRMWVPA